MERSSFFNAELKGEEYDRVYLAEDYARYFASFIGNGIFPIPSTNLQVIADGTTMNLTLKQGKAWINGYFYENTEDLTLSIDVADGVLNRIDRVVVRLDFINREIKTYVKKGTFASSPVAPTLQRNADMYELALADIRIDKGVTKLVQADITDLRNNNNFCGLVAGVVQQIDTTNLFAQFQSTFDIWFENIKDQLSEDAAGNLQNQIDLLKNNKINVTDIVNNLTSGGIQKVLSAEQGKMLKTLIDEKVNKTAIINNLTTGGVANILSAEQGKALKKLIDENTNEGAVGESGWYIDKKTGTIKQYGVFRYTGANVGTNYIATITMPTPFINRISTFIPTMYRCEKEDGTVVIANVKFKGYMIYTKSTIGVRFETDTYVEGSVLIAWEATGY